MSITILALGEIVGKPGVYAVKTGIKQLRKEHNIDLVIFCGRQTTQQRTPAEDGGLLMQAIKVLQLLPF
jgi:calcineurin-like phosphoesterase